MAKHDAQVQKLQAAVEARKADLGQRPKAALTTNGIFKYNDKDHVNINTLSDFDSVVRAYSHLLAAAERAVTAAEELGIPSFEFKYHGYSVEEWKQDFQLRVDLIKWTKKDAELKRMSAQLEALVSEDLKTATALKAIEDALAT